MTDTACYRILVAIETDATRYHGAAARAPALLGAADTDQLIAHLAADLAGIVPAAGKVIIAAAGAVLDQTQILRPGYPAFRALEAYCDGPGGQRRPVPARDGRIEPEALHPEPGIPPGILQLLPVVVAGPSGAIGELGQEMEHRFLEKGQVSAHTARWLESAFGITVRHARFMTLTDLNAMFRLQLEHFGFLPLWELVDAALSGRSDPLEAQAGDGQTYRRDGQAISTEFQTFDFWANQGAGRAMDSARGALAGGYADWTYRLRQYLTTLTAHAIPVTFRLPGEPREVLDGSCYTETARRTPLAGDAAVTEHSFDSLGTICITTVRNGRQQNHYPLRPSGLNDIQAAIGADGLAGATVAYPGTILHDANERVLLPERDPAEERP